MRCITPARHRKGYILQELVVGLVVFAIAVLPVIRAFRMLPQIGSALSVQSRIEAWRSVVDEAILQGIDPSQTAMMRGMAQLEVSNKMSGTVIRKDLSPRPGRVQITLLRNEFSSTAEERSVSMGFEIGGGSVPVPPREDPLPPLALIKMSAPLLNPLNGTMVPVLGLASPSVPGAPYVLSLRAQSVAASDLVRLRTIAPQIRTQVGAGSASVEIDAVELAQSVRGQAWTEYAGNEGTDTPVALSDGRTRWLVRNGGRTQVYEPSDPVDFVLGLDLGRPSYSVAGREYASGETLSINYEQTVAIDAGRAEATITYPGEVRDRFGSQWATVAPRFDWTFGSHPGDSSAGNTVSFFRPAGRAIWEASQTLTAIPAGLPGMRPLAGTWTLQRQATELAPPERVATFYDGSTDVPGWLEFSAPMISALKARVGRPQVNGVESVGNSVSVPIVP